VSSHEIGLLFNVAYLRRRIGSNVVLFYVGDNTDSEERYDHFYGRDAIDQLRRRNEPPPGPRHGSRSVIPSFEQRRLHELNNQ